ncbi:DUF2336 domain-containing protein [Chelatococcus sambhunathii]|uniref:DUF2336 domain-containing protein n=1 Tax=Chelatococcus sambhunathii TaxID=363953 RepID=A0ABU1DH88_9HYPH|nr:DUF2336 domain-containing protein [Chelatococcus sambhunathii]MDR4307485.1 DUF2336 domain-containing protein [Chelatococcus sambhunathii]
MAPNLLPVEALERLNRQDGVDTRPILVRVLTDLFVQQPEHTAEDVARYEELVGKLLDVVDVESRAAVARKLATDSRAPRSVIDRLLADEAAVSAPILARFGGAPRGRLLALALDGGPVEASAVASRTDIDDELVRTLVHHGDDLVLETLAANDAARLADGPLRTLVERALDAPALAATLLRRVDIDPAALAPLYRFAEPARRAAIRQALSTRAGRLAAGPRRPRSKDVRSLLSAAADANDPSAIAEALAEALDLKPDDAASLATDPSGEPFVMMLRAAGATDEQIVRAMLIGQPDIARSVERFFELVEIAETTPRGAAAELIYALVAPSLRPAAPRREPVFEPLGAPERPGAARPVSPRRPAERQDVARRRS